MIFKLNFLFVKNIFTDVFAFVSAGKINSLFCLYFHHFEILCSS
jgi:hypothetical protein